MVYELLLNKDIKTNPKIRKIWMCLRNRNEPEQSQQGREQQEKSEASGIDVQWKVTGGLEHGANGQVYDSGDR
jgi:hypothetical protein